MMKENSTLKIALVGDIFPGELPFTINYGIRTQFKMHRGKPWLTKINGILGENDITIGNLESPLIPNDLKVQSAFYGCPDFAHFLKAAGINIVNIANNHMLEQGKIGFKNTIQVLNSAGLGVVGYLESNESKILYLNVKDRKIAVAGFSNVDLHVIRNNNNFAVLNEVNVLQTLKAMAEAGADIKILCFHWGNEYIHIPQLAQRHLAYKLIDNGADIIAGHHPHVIQPYEQYKNGHIFYSLGNFMFDYSHSDMVSKGLVAHIKMAGSNGVKVALSGVKLSYKGTISAISPVSFDKYYQKINKLYNMFIHFSDEDYNDNYLRLLQKNHFRQRILMKTAIFKEFYRLKMLDKLHLLKNIILYYKTLVSK